MQELHSLLHSLTCSEWLALQGYLTCFTDHDPAKLKYMQLAKLLMDAEEAPSNTHCCLKLYGTKNDTSFEKLKYRLKEKTLDFLLSDISTDKKQELDEADYYIIKTKKKSAQFQQLFYSKKRISVLYCLLDEIIYLAKEYEQYSILADHLRFKKTIAGSNKSIGDFEKISEQMNSAWKFSDIVNKAEHSYYELMLLNTYASRPDKQKGLIRLEKNITDVTAGFELTHSPLILYYLKNLEMGYYQLTEDYFKARSVCLELLNIVHNNKSVKRKQRLAVVYDNLSQCEYYLGNYTQAAECAREAQTYFKEGSENYSIALEQEFYALFAMKQYDTSIDIANRMINSATRKELGEFRFSKYNYLHANALFMQGKFQETLTRLSVEREIATDKAGWETGARTLHIMTLVEMMKFDQASRALITLKRFMIRTDKKTPVSKRDKSILNLLLILERAGFMFSTLNGSTQKHLTALSSRDEEMHWEPFTHELIPFHEWFAGKMKVKMPVPVAGRKTLQQEPVTAK